MSTAWDAAAEVAIAEHEARLAEISDQFQVLRDHLTAQRLKDWAAYGAALQERLNGATADLDVPVEISIDPVSEEYELTCERGSLEWTLLEQAADESLSAFTPAAR